MPWKEDMPWHYWCCIDLLCNFESPPPHTHTHQPNNLWRKGATANRTHQVFPKHERLIPWSFIDEKDNRGQTEIGIWRKEPPRAKLDTQYLRDALIKHNGENVVHVGMLFGGEICVLYRRTHSYQSAWKNPTLLLCSTSHGIAIVNSQSTSKNNTFQILTMMETKTKVVKYVNINDNPYCV